MNVIQTLWLPAEDKLPIAYKSGWLSPEYHWIGWALSCFLLTKIYANVELYTTETGREILINRLQLPYTKVHILPNDIQITPFTWALAKLITYNLQEEPFIHIDGDIFVWKSFEDTFFGNSLIVQNVETNLDSYRNSFRILKEKINNETISNVEKEFDTVEVSYNAGIIGGQDVQFLKGYSQKSIKFVADNQGVDLSFIDASSYCMLFEQYMFALEALKNKKIITPFFKEPVSDLGYPGFDDFWVMKKKGYLHLMGQFKLNRYTLKMLISELRQNFTYSYYGILKLCKNASIILDYKVYQLPELDPLTHSVDYFISLLSSYKPDYIFNEHQPIDWIHYYAKDVYSYKQISEFENIHDSSIREQLFCVNYDFILIEKLEPILSQQIKFPDTCTLEIISIDLDEITMVIVDAFFDRNISILQLMEIVRPYFDSDDFSENENLLQEIIVKKVKKLLYWGVIRWLN